MKTWDGDMKKLVARAVERKWDFLRKTLLEIRP